MFLETQPTNTIKCRSRNVICFGHRPWISKRNTHIMAVVMALWFDSASLHVGSDFEMSIITILELEPHFQHHRYVWHPGTDFRYITKIIFKEPWWNITSFKEIYCEISFYIIRILNLTEEIEGVDRWYQTLEGYVCHSETTYLIFNVAWRLPKGRSMYPISYDWLS